ncbi:hypothetical protein RR48_08443 [Papilio machaon]|uniref:Uncharacterized protein n=1 Tax=Papilio machaon TaxID=76193 RepID=A0A194QR33_PAPMA|nr:hypothetical protein RR48_08443 [Papilio machaon]
MEGNRVFQKSPLCFFPAASPSRKLTIDLMERIKCRLDLHTIQGRSGSYKLFNSRASVQLSTPSWRTTKGCDYIGPRATRLPHAGLRINQLSRRNLTPTWKSASIAYWRELPSFCCFLPFSTIINASDKQQSTRVTSPFVYVYAATCALHSSDHTCVCEQSREAAADYEARSVSITTNDKELNRLSESQPAGCRARGRPRLAHSYYD